jgi:hypothetical protein
MSKRTGSPKRGGESAKPQSAVAAPVEPVCAPLKPRRKLLAVLMLGFAVWLGALLTLYFKTVYPQRHPSAAATRPGASALPSAPR